MLLKLVRNSFSSSSYTPSSFRIVIAAAIGLAACVSIGSLSANPAGAFSYTSVSPPPGGELSHEAIAEQIYGGDFVQSGVNYSNGTIDLVRVWDSDPGTMSIDILTGDATTDVDQVWTDGIANVMAEAKFAAFGQTWGWNVSGSTATSGDYVELLNQTDIGGPGLMINLTGPTLFGIRPSSGDTWWSREDQNSDTADHVVTYQVVGLGGPEVVWLQFWEDLPDGSSDHDYNDFVIQLTAIPEPGTALLLGLGLLGLAGMRRRG